MESLNSGRYAGQGSSLETVIEEIGVERSWDWKSLYQGGNVNR